jgi:hypothetical protein
MILAPLGIKHLYIAMMEKCFSTAQFHIQPTLQVVESLNKTQWIGGMR